MNSFKNKSKRESTKNKILSGSGHETHYSKKFIEQRKQSINTSCNCGIKWMNLFTENQLQDIFNRFNSMKSYSEQYLFLKSLVIPSIKETKVRQKYRK
jgi:hypothetical protein